MDRYKDEEKPKLELIDPDFIEGMARVQEIGDAKHKNRHWRGGVSVSDILGAIKRHIADIERGDYIDKDTSLQHAYHAACGLQYIAHYVRHQGQYEKFLDQPYKRSSTPGDDMGRQYLSNEDIGRYANQAFGGGGGAIQGPERGGTGGRDDSRDGSVPPSFRSHRESGREENAD